MKIRFELDEVWDKFPEAASLDDPKSVDVPDALWTAYQLHLAEGKRWAALFATLVPVAEKNELETAHVEALLENESWTATAEKPVPVVPFPKGQTKNLCKSCGGGFGGYTAPEARCSCA